MFFPQYPRQMKKFNRGTEIVTYTYSKQVKNTINKIYETYYGKFVLGIVIGIHY